MDVTHILEGLNKPQREAVTAPLGNALVLAGAGSGKTLVLVRRIAWLIKKEKVSPFSVLAVTFTNKAAAEMRQRIEALLDIPMRGLWVGTFHGIAHRLLRTHWREASLPQNFQVLDADDQLRLVKRIMRTLDIDEDQVSAREATWFINDCKDNGIRAKSLIGGGDPGQIARQRVYESYEELCQQGGLVDFGELLLRSHELWLEQAKLLDHYRARLNHLLVDEVQDTNTIQYAWLRLLAGDRGCVMAVGDDDQSIYGWRGARIEHMTRYKKDFDSVATYRLEQNYRSTGNILNAANALIRRNASRLGKELWTDGSDGEPLKLYAAYNDIDEARFIAERAKVAIEAGGSPEDVAVLYRSNAQSRVIEQALIDAKIPYRIHGGFRFFERAEVKNALAYMRLVQERHTDPAFERVVNTPNRGIGDKTVEVIRRVARRRAVSMWQASKEAIIDGGLRGRAAGCVGAFLKFIDDLAEGCANLELHKLTELVVRESGLLEFHGREPGERGLQRKENLQELVNAARQFTGELVFPLQDDDATEVSMLQEFLDQAALDAGEAQAGSGPAIQLMTLHSAKGLEFATVFLSGLEEGLFPHRMSTKEHGRLEEERRLCYVGITRAMQQLYLTYAETRRLHGIDTRNWRSRFIEELPHELIHEIRMGASRPSNRALIQEDGALRIGQRVHHAKFGEGFVLHSEGEGERARVQINFSSVGEKWLMLGYANLQPLD